MDTLSESGGFLQRFSFLQHYEFSAPFLYTEAIL